MTRSAHSKNADDDESDEPRAERRSREPREERRPRVKPVVLVRKAREQLEELIGMESESISALNKTGDGWQLNVEVVETPRVPDTTSILATYSVHLDSDGDLIGYERVRRYSRGRLDE
ncbi:gas vesicle protein [Saccharopolyspora rhizosphaerae]|uniref:Gas vesicle protein n=1 Tax=Saccharopolyspora rhizosphaerae TaxID=2492662 RepID=A0A3R8QSS2_9PSEU|nr:gas vesicle protein [Saccharopolyspora rhizosphaerae]RRO18714.1 gas vesicle protein [Saccharopolyspora rhizosphaerae]